MIGVFMPIPRSSLSKDVTQGYWVAVSKLLQKRFQLSLTKTQRAISSYKKELARTGVGDVIYHAPIQETVEGIINGGYVPLQRNPIPDKKSKSLKRTFTTPDSQSVHRRRSQKVSATHGESPNAPVNSHQDQPKIEAQRIGT